MQPLKTFFRLTDYEDENVLGHFKEVYGKEISEVDQDWRLFLKAHGEKN